MSETKKIEKSEIKKLAGLSKLSLTDAEIDSLTGDMRSIIAFADKISGAAISVGDDDYGAARELRADTVGVGECFTPGVLLSNAPTDDGAYFILPRKCP
ncbi:MAG: aspartyl/glutamyl-tRNA amidotransferase subunit C [Clostridiales bacterium]|nr:aspartyl/glutamyl-tRNA amidotransferase subunit C [Clostridiales bacterium]